MELLSSESKVDVDVDEAVDDEDVEVDEDKEVVDENMIDDVDDDVFRVVFDLLVSPSVEEVPFSKKLSRPASLDSSSGLTTLSLFPAARPIAFVLSSLASHQPSMPK